MTCNISQIRVKHVFAIAGTKNHMWKIPKAGMNLKRKKSWQSSKRMKSWFCIVLKTGVKKQRQLLQKPLKSPHFHPKGSRASVT